MAFLVTYDRKIILPICLAIFVSPVVVFPAHWNLTEGVYVSGGRLTGFLQTPIIFGFWMSIVFLIGLGLLIFFKRPWLKIVVTIWLIAVANFIFWAASRAAWIATVVAVGLCLLYYILNRDWKKFVSVLAVSLVATLIGYLFLPAHNKIKEYVKDGVVNLTVSVVELNPNKIQSQFQSHAWPEIIRFIKSNPLGLGFGSHVGVRLSRATESVPSAINSFLEIALYGGWAALLVFIVLLVPFQLSFLHIAWEISPALFLL